MEKIFHHWKAHRSITGSDMIQNMELRCRPRLLSSCGCLSVDGPSVTTVNCGETARTELIFDKDRSLSDDLADDV